jgi:hypothetical protein
VLAALQRAHHAVDVRGANVSALAIIDPTNDGLDRGIHINQANGCSQDANMVLIFQRKQTLCEYLAILAGCVIDIKACFVTIFETSTAPPSNLQ